MVLIKKGFSVLAEYFWRKSSYLFSFCQNFFFSRERGRPFLPLYGTCPLKSHFAWIPTLRVSGTHACTYMNWSKQKKHCIVILNAIIKPSVSDPDPDQETLIWIQVPNKNRDKLAFKSTKFIKIEFFKKEITNFV